MGILGTILNREYNLVLLGGMESSYIYTPKIGSCSKLILEYLIKEKKMDCRGKSRREEIVNEYNVVPVIHAKLLKGQVKHSDATALITDQYYIFECTHKDTGKREIIQCGMGAAKHLLELTHSSPLPIFNLLKASSTKGRKSVSTDSSTKKKWNKMAKQLYNAIMILIIAWNAEPDTYLIKLKKEAEKYSCCEPYLSRIKKVNRLITKDFKKRKLNEILNDLRKENDIRDYKFDLLEGELKKNGISSYF